MFRKNYLPKLEIRKSSETGKWFAYRKGEWCNDSFLETDDGYSIRSFENATQYETIDALMQAIYEYSWMAHLEAIHKSLTYNQVKVRL